MGANRYTKRSWVKHLVLTLPLLIGAYALCLATFGVSLPEKLVCGRLIETETQAASIVMSNLRAHYLAHLGDYMPGWEPSLGGTSLGRNGYWQVEASAHKSDGCIEEYFAEVTRCGGAVVSSYKIRTQDVPGSFC